MQQARRRGWQATAIESELTALGKDERAISVSGYVYQGLVKITQEAFDKVSTYKATTRNHLLGQVVGFRVGDKDSTRQDDLLRLFTEIGLADVVESYVTIAMDFENFEDLWRPIANGEGTLGKYVLDMDEAKRAAFERHLRMAYEGGEPDGARRFHCSAYVARGVVPANN